MTTKVFKTSVGVMTADTTTKKATSPQLRSGIRPNPTPNSPHFRRRTTWRFRVGKSASLAI